MASNSLKHSCRDSEVCEPRLGSWVTTKKRDYSFRKCSHLKWGESGLVQRETIFKYILPFSGLFSSGCVFCSHWLFTNKRSIKMHWHWWFKQLSTCMICYTRLTHARLTCTKWQQVMLNFRCAAGTEPLVTLKWHFICRLFCLHHSLMDSFHTSTNKRHKKGKHTKKWFNQIG